MIYQSGTYSSMHDLLGTIKTFLQTNGWTINKWELDQQGYQSYTGLDYTGAMRLHIQKTASDSSVMYFNFKSVKRGIIFGDHLAQTSQINGRYYSEIRGIGINGSTGYNAGEDWDEQPGYPVSKGTSKSIGACITELPGSSGTYSYYIFHSTDACVIVVQIGDNRFVYLAFGLLKKSGVYTGGQFYAGSSESYQPSYRYWYESTNRRDPWRAAFLGNIVDGYSYKISTLAVYLNVDGSAAWRHNGKEGSDDSTNIANLQTGAQVPYSRTDDSGVYRQYAISLNEFIYDRSPSHFNNVSILAPVYIFVRRATERYTYIGRPEGVRVLNRTPYTSGAEFSIASDTWKVFPAFDIEDELSTIINFSPHVGFAFLKTEV